MTLILLIYTFPDWITALYAWFMSLSRAMQVSALLGSQITGINGAAEKLLHCVASHDCIWAYSATDGTPQYTNHGCVGTALIAADAVLHKAVIVLPLSYFLLSHRRRSAALLLASLMATSVSAVLHVRKTCAPGAVIEAGNVFEGPGWAVFDPVPADTTTARFALLTDTLAMLLMCHWAWDHREILKAYVRDDPIRIGAQWVYWFFTTFVAPAIITNFWVSFYDAHDEGRSSDSTLGYALFSLTNSLLIPLMGMYPALAGFVRKLRSGDVESESDSESAVAPTDKKASAPASSFQSPAEKKSDNADPSKL
ncbi:hypothetical protein BV20DRAFT_961141 [Pilatotrama ljubarskyi]|nr:hypothetical protein BV20DRAFT_961141 [Pilatotrama ljubarskyi]